MFTGVLFDVDVFTAEMRKNLGGDITFLEAYNKTRRILNITVSSSTNFEMPRLLNYLTAPNVVSFIFLYKKKRKIFTSR
jgi:TAG lipase/steryl ester hydrolase/phospholipase A2/LPA acyltransferase